MCMYMLVSGLSMCLQRCTQQKMYNGSEIKNILFLFTHEQNGVCYIGYFKNLIFFDMNDL